jgi:sugar lactone lactonase YvrE
VLPVTRPAAGPVRSPSPDLTILNSIATPGMVKVRSFTLAKVGSVVTLDDGSITVADGDGRLGRTVEPPPCAVAGAASGGRGLLALCTDGRLFGHEGGRWTSAGRAPAAAGLAGWPESHVWGPGGLYREHADGRWIRLVTGPVTAAAVSADGLAWSDGVRLVISDRRGAERALAMPSHGISHLALHGGDLWAVDGRGRVLRSGGGLLPWREPLPPTLRAAALAGDGTRLIMVLDDGLLAAWRAEPCDSPWQAGTGDRPGALREPRGVAVAPAGWFVVADTRNYRVQWFDRDGACLDRWGQRGAGVGQFEDPAGVAVAGDGTLAVADTWNGRVQVLEPGGAALVAVQGLYGPRGVLWWHDDVLFIADTGNQRVLRWSPGDHEPVVVAALAAKPIGLARAGELLAVALPAAGHIALLDPTSGAIRTTLEVPSWRGGKEVEAYLATLPDGRLAASSPEAGRLWLVDPGGEARPKELADGLQGASGVGILPDGTVVVSLTWGHRLARVPLAIPPG